MRFAAPTMLIVLTAAAFAATNVTEVACVPLTNAVPMKVSIQASKAVRPQCEATTLSGNRCKRHSAEGAKYCSQHIAILRKREKKAEIKKP